VKLERGTAFAMLEVDIELPTLRHGAHKKHSAPTAAPKRPCAPPDRPSAVIVSYNRAMADEFLAYITPLRRCLELLKLADQIGAQEWLAERAIKAYLDSVADNFASKMQALGALQILWNEHNASPDLHLILNCIEKTERDLRDHGQISNKG
jgi:hypothetical protein